LKSAESLLLEKARSLELDALSGSQTRSNEMRAQLAQLKDLKEDSGTLHVELTDKEIDAILHPRPSAPEPPSLQLPDPGPIVLGSPSNFPEKTTRPHVKIDLSALSPSIESMKPRSHTPSPRIPRSYAQPFNPESELAKFSNQSLFPDSALRLKLKSAFEKQKELEEKLVEIVQTHYAARSSELREVLGDQFTRYQQLIARKAAASRRDESDFKAPDIPGFPGFSHNGRPDLRPGEYDPHGYRPEPGPREPPRVEMARPHPIIP